MLRGKKKPIKNKTRKLFLVDKMEASHIFYTELPLDEIDIFSTNLAEKNKIKEIKFKKSKNHVP